MKKSTRYLIMKYIESYGLHSGLYHSEEIGPMVIEEITDGILKIIRENSKRGDTE